MHLIAEEEAAGADRGLCPVEDAVLKKIKAKNPSSLCIFRKQPTAQMEGSSELVVRCSLNDGAHFAHGVSFNILTDLIFPSDDKFLAYLLRGSSKDPPRLLVDSDSNGLYLEISERPNNMKEVVDADRNGLRGRAVRFYADEFGSGGNEEDDAVMAGEGDRNNSSIIPQSPGVGRKGSRGSGNGSKNQTGGSLAYKGKSAGGNNAGEAGEIAGRKRPSKLKLTRKGDGKPKNKYSKQSEGKASQSVSNGVSKFGGDSKDSGSDWSGSNAATVGDGSQLMKVFGPPTQEEATGSGPPTQGEVVGANVLCTATNTQAVSQEVL